VGISLTTTLLARESQSHQTVLAQHLTPYSPAFNARVYALSMGQPQYLPRAFRMIYHELVGQATVMAFVSNFRLMAILCVCGLPLVLLFKRGRKVSGPIEVH
jgi:DHA2 family multidrug resistance protein